MKRLLATGLLTIVCLALSAQRQIIVLDQGKKVYDSTIEDAMEKGKKLMEAAKG